MARFRNQLEGVFEDTEFDRHRFNEDTQEYEYVNHEGKTREQVLADYADKANRLNAVSGVYQRADRIVAQDSDITVTVVDDPEMKDNAMNDGRNVIFNSRLIADISNDNIAHLHGLNYHELAHILFSPRAGSDLIRYVKDNKFKRAVNVLEEARAEALLIAKYSTTRLFLESNVMTNVMNSKDMADQFPLITGRTYLPLELRQAVADKFIAKYGVDMARLFHSLIHEYKSLVFPRDFDKAKKLISRMANLIGTDDEPIGCFPTPIDTHDTTMTKGRPEGKSEQDRLQDKISKDGSSSEDLSGEPKAPKDNGDNGNDMDKSFKAGNTASEDYTGADKSFTDTDKAIADLINKRMKDITDNDLVKRTVDETRKAILGSDDVDMVMPKADYSHVEPKPNVTSIARRFSQELERIVRDNDPSWDKFNARGKLNITRTMNPDINAIRTHFDQWDTGNPNTDIEAVICIDNSGSMHTLMRDVTETAWILKRGIENIDGSVTLFTFNHESKIVYDKSEKAKASAMRYVYSSGGTNPIRSLLEAERILSASKKSIKLAFIITDGEWHMSKACDKIIKSMNDKGILTCVVYMTDFDNSMYKYHVEKSKDMSATEEDRQYALACINELRHGAQVFHAVADNKSLLKLAQELVKSMLNTNRAVA